MQTLQKSKLLFLVTAIYYKLRSDTASSLNSRTQRLVLMVSITSFKITHLFLKDFDFNHSFPMLPQLFRIKIKPNENSTIILKIAITAKLCRKDVFLVLCLKIIIAAIEPSIPKINVVAKSAFSGILKMPNWANNLSMP